jgi:hypothetical protein
LRSIAKSPWLRGGWRSPISKFIFHRLTLAVCSRIRRNGVVEIEIGLGDPRLPKSAFAADQMRQAEATQDIDVVTESTESTSILTDASMIGEKNTRAMAAWAARRGFSTSRQERMFAAYFKRQADEPAVALCGLDNAAGLRVAMMQSVAKYRRIAADGTHDGTRHHLQVGLSL